MTNEEFQRIVLESLNELREGQNELKEVQKVLIEKIDAVYEKTTNLMEFRYETNKKLDEIMEDYKSIHGMLGEHEVSIRTLRRMAI